MSNVSRKRLGVITGASSGVGWATARALACKGFDLVLVGRNCRRGGALRKHLERWHPDGRFQFVACDLSNLPSVRHTAELITKAHPFIDVLINNAGARFDTFQQSVNGFELTFATNHLGHFLLTLLLMDSLHRSGAGRVITVSSRVHRSASTETPWLMSFNCYDRKQAYAKSKLANVLFAFELARRMQGMTVVSNAVEPGVLATRFARNNGLVAWARHVIPHFLRGELTSVTSAGESMAHLATSPKLAGISGRLFSLGTETAASGEAQDREAAARLWAESLECTRSEALREPVCVRGD